MAEFNADQSAIRGVSAPPLLPMFTTASVWMNDSAAPLVSPVLVFIQSQRPGFGADDASGYRGFQVQG